MPREILLSEAFKDLSGKAVKILLLAWNQVYFDTQNRMKNNVVYLPHYACMGIGVNSSQTITRARNELVEKGFLDVYQTGSMKHASQFTISERWKSYPLGHHRKDSRPAGRTIYPASSLKNPDHPIHRKRAQGIPSI